MERLLEDMQDATTGVATKNRKVLRPLAMGYRVYKDCFVGSDAVSWVVAHSPEHSTRQAAMRLLQAWLEAGQLRPVGTDERRFEDDKSAHYQFASATANAATAMMATGEDAKSKTARKKNLPAFRAGRRCGPTALRPRYPLHRTAHHRARQSGSRW